MKRTERPIGLVSFGLASIIMAGGAIAQEPAPAQPAPDPADPQPGAQLPEVTVTTKPAPKAKKKRVVAKKKTAPAPVPAPPSAPGETQSATIDPGTSSIGGPFTPSSGNTLQAGTGIGRLPGSIQSTPQVVNVVPQQQLKEQNATSIDRALRNVPGVTVSSGEGGGGFNGDQFRIRGIEAKGDLFIDGLRDFGVYVRDTFSIQEIQVLKGPSSETFGIGTTGGVINLRQKSAHLGDETSIETSIGTGPLYRTVVDVNKQIDATTAVRAVGLYHEQDWVDRDHVYSDRWGFFGSAGFGLGTDTTWILNYLHQDGDRRPDYGVPNVIRSNTTSGGAPSTEHGLPRSAFFGKEQDHDDTKVDMVTSLFRHRIHEGLTIHNDTRLAFYERNLFASVPNCQNGASPDNNANVVPGCADQFLDGLNPLIAYGGGNPAYDQEAWSFQNITSAVARFHTGMLRHEVVGGIDVSYQKDERQHFTVAGKVVPNIRNPEFSYLAPYTFSITPGNYREGDGTNLGAFISDRLWFTPEVSVLAGVRWDYFESNFFQEAGANPEVNRTSEAYTTTPKVSLIWEPTPRETYYVSYAQSVAPIGQFVTNFLNPIPADNQENLVEESESYEVGVKYSLLDGRLGVTAAIFQVNKANATAFDDATSTVVLTGEEQRFRGFEIGATGSITPAWTVFAGYTYIDSEILDGPTLNFVGPRTSIGADVGGVPEHAASLWTTYNLSDDLIHGPGVWTIGGGFTYLSEMYTVNNISGGNLATAYSLPDQYTIDALISYEIDGWRLAANGYNLTDSLNYDASFNQRSVPSAGRSYILSVGKTF